MLQPLGFATVEPPLNFVPKPHAVASEDSTKESQSGFWRCLEDEILGDEFWVQENCHYFVSIIIQKQLICIWSLAKDCLLQNYYALIEMTFREGLCELYIYSSCYRHPHLIPREIPFKSCPTKLPCQLASISFGVSEATVKTRNSRLPEPWRRSCDSEPSNYVWEPWDRHIYLYTYIPWDPKIMKNKGFGHPKTRLFTIKKP